MSIFDLGFVWGDSVYDVASTWEGWFFMLDDPRALQSRVVVYAIPYVWIWGQYKCRNGVDLHLSKVERVSSNAIEQRYKHCNRADLVQARLDAYDQGCDDALLFGPDGRLTEGPGFNVCIVKNGKVLSPDHNVLEGITCRSVRELCETESIDFEFCKLSAEELHGANEVFASTTAGGVIPVTHLDHQPIGNGHVGLPTSRLQRLYWAQRKAGWHGTRVEDILLADVD